MQSPQMMGYDRAITVFSPQGRLYQVEYAREAVKKGTISLGLVYEDGVVLAADKNVTEELMLAESIEKVYQIDEHMGAATSGLVADGRRIIDRARIMAQSHRITYDEPMGVDMLTRDICDLQQLHTQVAGSRPFGTALLIGGVDGRPHLYETDPSGSYWEYKATAIGENSDKVKAYFAKHYKESIDLNEAVDMAVKALEKIAEARFNERSVEIAYITTEKKFVKLKGADWKKQLKTASEKKK
ncbi:TPA: archaeal proteasome endopeptidase complex subunit alpha [archaeon]|nr:archaeal proteasome endopeptidase complex subunit alpha [Candidatus Naiadarchaeales archaeon SRR2090153.bin461]